MMVRCRDVPVSLVVPRTYREKIQMCEAQTIYWRARASVVLKVVWRKTIWCIESNVAA